jgi:excisionase family DNA binding protein
MNGTSIILQNVTRQDLTAIIESAVSGLIKDFHPSPEVKTEYLTRKEVAALLRISIPTLHQLIKTGKLKGYRIGGRVLFNKAEVEGSLEEIETLKYKQS